VASPGAYINYASLSPKQRKRTVMQIIQNSVQVNKSRSNGKKEKEKIHVSNEEWRIIMSAINHGTEVPANSRREVLMGYQYALGLPFHEKNIKSIPLS
jgi:hypothetical protein